MFEAIGFIAAILTTISFIPQAIKTIKTKNTESISLTMYLVFTVGVLLWLVYGIYIRDWALLLANGFTAIFSIIILSFKIISVRKDYQISKSK